MSVLLIDYEPNPDYGTIEGAPAFVMTAEAEAMWRERHPKIAARLDAEREARQP